MSNDTRKPWETPIQYNDWFPDTPDPVNEAMVDHSETPGETQATIETTQAKIDELLAWPGEAIPHKPTDVDSEEELVGLMDDEEVGPAVALDDDPIDYDNHGDPDAEFGIEEDDEI